MLFYQANAPYQRSMITMAKIQVIHFELIPDSPYSPDLPSSNAYLCAVPKKYFESNDETKASYQSSYKNGIEMFENNSDT